MEFKDTVFIFSEDAGRFTECRDGMFSEKTMDKGDHEAVMSRIAYISAVKHKKRAKALKKSYMKEKADGILYGKKIDPKSLREERKEIRKEVRRAAIRRQVSKVIQNKTDGEVTGDAFEDGKKGLVKTFFEPFSVETHLKSIWAKALSLIIPHLISVFMFVTFFMIIVSILAAMLSSIDTLIESI